MGSKSGRTNKRIDDSRIMVGNFNTPFTMIGRPTRQKISKDVEGLNSTINQQELIDMYTTHHHKTAEYTLFLSAHKMNTNIVHVLRHKTNQKQF